jgi:hypothetical protein
MIFYESIDRSVLLVKNKSGSALISLGQIRRSGIEGVFYLQFLIGLDPRETGRLRWMSCAYPQFKNFIVSLTIK